ncbi:MAG: gliding motility-associated C-terminal domain-containing protein [Bacteroidetes bacterium]|nr:gliding motility-associated C-terminal domain-containing protein [Bacteroidota bacterium]
MKKFLLFFLFLLHSKLFIAQSPFWLQSEGSPSIDENLDIAKDNNNCLISTGYFTGTLILPNGTGLTATGTGTSDVLIQKTNPYGQVQWAVKAGGAGSDRGISAACDAAGNTYITGYYYGAAQFGAFTLNSVSGSQDVFIAKLDQNGNFLWAKSAGGPLAEDPYSITVDANNNAIVTGEFKGSSVFGSQTLTSTINPFTNQYSFDVFTCKYDQNGNFVWVRQGAAHLDDRGLDVGTDAAGNIFVCGQFSDTITFGSTHLNQIQNAIFILKYNAAGQEQWFVRAGAASSISYALAVDASGSIYVTGDYTGNLSFYGTTNNFLYGTFINRIFLVKYSNNGSYIWGKEDASNSYVSSRAIALDNAQNPYIFGQFGCKMDDYSLLAGGTGMFNSIGFYDLFITQYDASGNRIWARNFGGPLYDKAHGIVFTNNNTPYVCGSFQGSLTVDSRYTPFDIDSHFPGNNSWISLANCNNSANYYQSVNAAGFSDCFILHGLDSSCAYYDYYARSGIIGACTKNFVGGCIGNACPDTVSFCGPNYIYAYTHTGNIGGVGPFYHYSWNVGDTTNYLLATASGNYHCTMTTIDGCFSSGDTMYVRLYNAPQPPTITDNIGVNTNQAPPTHSVEVCGGTVTLTGGNLQGCSYTWYGTGIVSTSSTSCVVNKTGFYTFKLTNSYGCTDTNVVYIQIDTANHIGLKTNMPDTFRICQGQCINYFIYDSISNPAGTSPYSAFTSLNQVNPVSPYASWCCGSFASSNNLSLLVCPVATGTINLHSQYVFSSLCGKDTTYFNKIIYVIVNPNPHASINLAGNALICPGDTSLLIATVTVTPSVNTIYTVSPNDTIRAAYTGYYNVSVTATDTITHCFASASSGLYAQMVSNPVISSVPSNGIICPNDSIELLCNWPNAVSWQWYGPSGIIPHNSQSIHTSIPGFYYCVATNNTSCVLTSNTIEIKQYSTPYLTASPQATVCAGHNVQLHVISGDTNFIQWLPPLNGHGATRIVTQSGLYSCNVVLCGITTVCSVSITVSQPIAHISITGSTVICPGDSVLLQANVGMASYQWLPNNQASTSIYAYTAGNYTLITTDVNGCQARDSVTITYSPGTPAPPTVSNDSICAGANAVLQAMSSNTVQWYAQSYGGAVIHVGSSLLTPPLYVDTIFYVASVNGFGCHSIRKPIYVYVKNTSIKPTVSATKDTLCYLDTLYLQANFVAGATYHWYGPNGFSSSQPNPQINAVTASSGGTYSLYLSGNGCTSATATLNISVIKVNTPTLSLTNDSICAGRNLTLYAQPPISGYHYTWAPPSGNTISSQTFSIINASNTNTGTYTLQASMGLCKSTSSIFSIYVKPSPTLTINTTQINLCSNDSLILYAQTTPISALAHWQNLAGFNANANPAVFFPITTANSGYYYCYASLNGCTAKDSVKVIVNKRPNSVSTSTSVCVPPIILKASSPNALYYLWSDGSHDSIKTITASGTYWITYSLNSSCTFTDTFHIAINQNQFADSLPNIVTPNNDKINDYVDFGKYHFLTVQIDIYDRWGIKVFESSDVNAVWAPQCVDGTYFYIISYKEDCSSENNFETKRGFITVVR